MKFIVISAILMAVAGCDSGSNYPGDEAVQSEIRNQPRPMDGNLMRVFHDDQRNVTCWLAGSGTLACWPDWMLSDQGVKP